MARLQARILELLKSIFPAFRLYCDPRRPEFGVIVGVSRATLLVPSTGILLGCDGQQACQREDKSGDVGDMKRSGENMTACPFRLLLRI